MRSSEDQFAVKNGILLLFCGASWFGGSRRIWAVCRLSAAVTLAAMPCWILEFPAKDYPTTGSPDYYLPDLLKRVQVLGISRQIIGCADR